MDKEMKRMYQYPLDFSEAMQYVNEVLDESNALASSLLQSVAFSSGHFFAYLPAHINRDNLLNFLKGGISSNNYKETARFILEIMQKDQSLSLIVDDVIRNTDDKNIKTFGTSVLIHNTEVYYLIENHIANQDIIFRCLHETDAIWHTMSVLAEDIHLKEHLNIQEIEKISQKTKVIVIGAYDGEGYIFWRKDYAS